MDAILHVPYCAPSFLYYGCHYNEKHRVMDGNPNGEVLSSAYAGGRKKGATLFAHLRAPMCWQVRVEMIFCHHPQ
jgi:hypothetical protein